MRSVLQRLEGSEALVAGLLYGSGLRLMEALRLRVHDLDSNRQELIVRNGKDGKDSAQCNRNSYRRSRRSILKRYELQTNETE